MSRSMSMSRLTFTLLLTFVLRLTFVLLFTLVLRLAVSLRFTLWRALLRVPPPPPPPPPPPRLPPPPRCASVVASATSRATAMAMTDRRMRFMVNLLLLAGLGRFDHLHAADPARGHEREGAVVERGREIPGVRRDILRPRLVGERRQDDLARQREVAQLNPYL